MNLNYSTIENEKMKPALNQNEYYKVFKNILLTSVILDSSELTKKDNIDILVQIGKLFEVTIENRDNQDKANHDKIIAELEKKFKDSKDEKEKEEIQKQLANMRKNKEVLDSKDEEISNLKEKLKNKQDDIERKEKQYSQSDREKAEFERDILKRQLEAKLLQNSTGSPCNVNNLNVECQKSADTPVMPAKTIIKKCEKCK